MCTRCANDLCTFLGILDSHAHSEAPCCCVCARGLPHRPKLSMLAYTHLKRAIQTGGHNSIEDAQAAMDLALLKIRRGTVLQLLLLLLQAWPCEA